MISRLGANIFSTLRPQPGEGYANHFDRCMCTVTDAYHGPFGGRRGKQGVYDQDDKHPYLMTPEPIALSENLIVARLVPRYCYLAVVLDKIRCSTRAWLSLF